MPQMFQHINLLSFCLLTIYKSRAKESLSINYWFLIATATVWLQEMITVMLFSWKLDLAVCPVQSTCWNISIGSKGTSGKIVKFLLTLLMFSCEKIFHEFIPVASILRILAHLNKINVTTKPDALLLRTEKYNYDFNVLVIMLYLYLWWPFRFARWFWGGKSLIITTIIIK